MDDCFFYKIVGVNFNLFLLLSFLILFGACTDNNESTTDAISPLVQVDTLVIPDVLILDSILVFSRNNSLWTKNEELYSGYAICYYEDGIPKEKFGILNGRKQGVALKWAPDGELKYKAYYHKGKLHGDKKVWSSDEKHVLLSHLKYHLGKLHGEQKKWYDTGELFKHLQMNMGREEGMQHGYRKNGVLFANYEVREGRTFGLQKSILCFGLEDENIQNEN